MSLIKSSSSWLVVLMNLTLNIFRHFERISGFGKKSFTCCCIIESHYGRSQWLLIGFF